MPACSRCSTLVDTNVLGCSVQGRLTAVLLCLRCVDIVAFGAWFVPSWCAQRKKRRFKTEHFVVICVPRRPYGYNSRADDTASFDNASPRRAPSQQSVMFTSRLVLPSAMTWTEKSACVANLPRSHKHTRGLPVLLLLLWCCCIALGCCGAATTAAYVALLSSRHL